MNLRKAVAGLGRVRAWLPMLGVLLLASCSPDHYPQTTLAPKGDFARIVDSVFMGTMFWATIVFVLVEGALLFAIFKFRGSPDDPEPEQTHGNAAVEVIWTIIPAAILAFIAVPTVRAIFKTAEHPDNAITVEVVGHQWWWEFRYPELGVVTAYEMHVPKGKPVFLKIRTDDVLHSFWVPQFAAKRDAFQNKFNTMFFTADTTGWFPGQCAEFCGTQHARMASAVVVQEPADFDAWVANQRIGSPLVNGGKVEAKAPDSTATVSKAKGDTATAAPAEDPLLARGKAAFMAGGCIGCHAMMGQPTAGMMVLKGPNLSHVGSRTRIAAGILENTDANLALWLKNPDAVKQGTTMKLPRPLTDEEISALVAYLRAHK